MNSASPSPFPGKSIDQQAADWVVRSERGLDAAEQDDFLQWLMADPRHGAAVARHKENWRRLDRLGDWRPEHSPLPNRDLLAPPPQRRFARLPSLFKWSVPLAVAAAVALGVFFTWSREPVRAPVSASAPLAAIEQRTLDDGSVVELNRGADISVRYTAGERRVELLRGEAHFTVAKNKARPFTVSAGGVAVRAVGTAFNVRFAESSVDVLVTEGVVGVHRVEPGGGDASAIDAVELKVGERTSVSLTAKDAVPEVAKTTPEQVAQLLAWQPRLLDFTATPLMGVVAEFNRHNAPLRLVVADAELATTEVSATLRSDNVEGFIRLLEAGFGVRAEREGDTIRLRKGR